MASFVFRWLPLILERLRPLVPVLGCSDEGGFPKPLSSEDEARYLDLLRKGDPSAKRILIEHNLRLVAHVVKKFDNVGEPVDDLISIGTVGLVKAIETYDETKGTRLATYAARCIENEILMFLRSTRRARREVFLYEPIGTDQEGNEITLMDVLGSDADEITDAVSSKMELETLIGKMNFLDRKERRVLELRYGLNGGPAKTQREVAAMLGISRSYISRIEKKAVSRLWREMATEGYI